MSEEKPKNLMNTTNASEWAEEFFRLWGDRLDQVDESLMLSWFASAIMCGSDHTFWRYEKELQAARRVCELVQRKVNTDDWEEDNAKRQENLQNEHELLKALEAYKQVRGE